MSYAVMVGSGGYAGWKILERTAEAQLEAVGKESQVQVSRDYFISSADKVKTADDLVSNYRMLKIALTAFGLEGDINNKAFIKKVLESDLNDEKSFANKLSDKRYLKIADSLRLGGTDPAGISTDSESIFNSYVEAIFNIRVGNIDNNLRLALNARKELTDLAKSSSSENSFWYNVIGSKSLRAVFEGAFKLPPSFGRISVDRQLSELKIRAERMFGTSDPKVFSEPDGVENAIRSFLLNSQLKNPSTTNRFSVALTLLSP